MFASSGKSIEFGKTKRPKSWIAFVLLAVSGTLCGLAWQIAETHASWMRGTPLRYYIDKDGNLAYLGLAALIALAALSRGRGFAIIYVIIAVYLGTFALDPFRGAWAGHVPAYNLTNFITSHWYKDFFFFLSSILIFASIVPLYLYRRWFKRERRPLHPRTKSPKPGVG